MRPRRRRWRWRVVLRKVFRRVIYSRGSTQSIAAGAALGVFVGLTPTVGFQMLIAAFLATVFRLNRLAAVLPVWMTNPVTIAPIYYFEFQVGSWMTGSRGGEQVMEQFRSVQEKVAAVSISDLWNTMGAALAAMGGLGTEILFPLIVGSIICGVVGAAITYPVALWTLKRIRRGRELRSIRKAEDRIEELKAAGLLVEAGTTPRRVASGEEPDATRGGTPISPSTLAEAAGRPAGRDADSPGPTRAAFVSPSGSAGLETWPVEGNEAGAPSAREQVGEVGEEEEAEEDAHDLPRLVRLPPRRGARPGVVPDGGGPSDPPRGGEDDETPPSRANGA